MVRNKTHCDALVGSKEKAKAGIVLLEQYTLKRDHLTFARSRRHRALEQSARCVKAQLQRTGTCVGDNLIVYSPSHTIRNRSSQSAASQNDFRAAEVMERHRRSL